MKFTLIAALPLATVLVWVLALAVDPGPYAERSVLLIGIGLISLTAIGTVGLILVGSKWAYRLLVLMIAVTLLFGIIRPIDPIGVAAIAMSGLSVLAMFAPSAQRLVRKLPAASGPPASALIVTLLGISTPLLLGLVPAQPNQWVLGFALAIPLFSFIYSRTIEGGLALMRFGTPLAGLAMSPLMPLPHGIVAMATAATITVISWRGDVAIAFRPLIEKGTTYAIPPELAPSEILDGAGLDERGMRR